MTKMPSQPTEYNIKAMSPMTPYGSFDNQENADVLAMPASDVQSEQVGMKKARHRPSGHALPFE
jgi:hypothetical protein